MSRGDEPKNISTWDVSRVTDICFYYSKFDQSLNSEAGNKRNKLMALSDEVLAEKYEKFTLKVENASREQMIEDLATYYDLFF